MSIDRAAVVPGLELLYASRFELGRMVDIGATPLGLRRMIPITGGTFEGPKLAGRVLPGGEDWQLVRSDGVVAVDARYVLETTTGARIRVRNRGILTAPREVLIALGRGELPAADSYYFRTHPVFETGYTELGWLQKLTAVGVGEVKKGSVLVTVYAVS